MNIDGKELPDAAAIARWFCEAAVSREGVRPWQEDIGERLADEDYTPEMPEVVVRVLDAGPNEARKAICTYLRLHPINAPALTRAWARWIVPPAPWLDDRVAGSSLPLGAHLSFAAENCGIARNAPDVAEAFLSIADRYGTRRLWTLALALGDPKGGGPRVLREGLARGLVLDAAAGDMLGWEYANKAADRVVDVATLLADQPLETREAYARAAAAHVPPEVGQAIRSALRLG